MNGPITLFKILFEECSVEYFNGIFLGVLHTPLNHYYFKVEKSRLYSYHIGKKGGQKRLNIRLLTKILRPTKIFKSYVFDSKIIGEGLIVNRLKIEPTILGRLFSRPTFFTELKVRYLDVGLIQKL